MPNTTQRILAFCAQKGGTGKTTLSAHMAAIAATQGYSVALLDLDPQGSLRAWYQKRPARGRGDLIFYETALRALPQTIQEVRGRGATLVIIDTPPKKDAEIIAAAGWADCVVLPVRTSMLDLTAIAPTVGLLRGAPQTRGGRHVAVLNAVRSGDPDVAGARVYLERELELRVAGSAVGDRVAIRRAMNDGQTATETEPRGRAADELRALWTELAEAFRQPQPRETRKGITGWHARNPR